MVARCAPFLIRRVLVIRNKITPPLVRQRPMPILFCGSMQQQRYRRIPLRCSSVPRRRRIGLVFHRHPARLAPDRPSIHAVPRWRFSRGAGPSEDCSVRCGELCGSAWPCASGSGIRRPGLPGRSHPPPGECRPHSDRLGGILSVPESPGQRSIFDRTWPRSCPGRRRCEN
jgi:hypothetical protein